MKRNLGLASCFGITFLLLAAVLPAKVTQAKEITLQWASFLPKNSPETKEV